MTYGSYAFDGQLFYKIGRNFARNVSGDSPLTLWGSGLQSSVCPMARSTPAVSKQLWTSGFRSRRYFEHLYNEICIALNRRVSRYQLWPLAWEAGGDPDDSRKMADG